MTVLYLMRHGEAENAAAGDGDHERALTQAGQEAAGWIGRALTDAGLVPDLVLCSSARRAAETWAAMVDELARVPSFLEEEALYLASAPALSERLAALPPEAATVLLIGHNPGLHQLALALAGDGSADALAALQGGFPAGAMAAIEFARDDWSGLESAAGRLLWFPAPEGAY